VERIQVEVNKMLLNVVGPPLACTMVSLSGLHDATGHASINVSAVLVFPPVFHLLVHDKILFHFLWYVCPMHLITVK
jgi:hypothetical protein